jgi:tellurite resistance protein TerC
MTVWIGFIGLLLVFLAVDLGVFHQKAREISSKEAGIWTAIWVSLSFLFSGFLFQIYENGWVENPTHLRPDVASLKFLSGYLIELSLSVDNIFVMAIIFTAFKIPKKYQHRVLFWGILGAIVFRGLLIGAGVVLLHQLSWMIYVFAGFLIYTALKMLFQKEEGEFNPKKSVLYRWIRKIMPITRQLDGDHFLVKRRHIRAATPLLVALLLIEVMDVVFALDSVPAILSITSDPFLVFTSNIFAILGLRSLYFFLANMLEKFTYLEYSLIAILLFVGIKMCIASFFVMEEWVSLAFIAVSLLTGILYSLYKTSTNN